MPQTALPAATLFSPWYETCDIGSGKRVDNIGHVTGDGRILARRWRRRQCDHLTTTYVERPIWDRFHFLLAVVNHVMGLLTSPPAGCAVIATIMKTEGVNWRITARTVHFSHCWH